MPDLVVSVTVRAVRFETFVFFLPDQTAERDAVSLTFSQRLSSHFVCLMAVETRSSPLIPIAHLARDSKTCEVARMFGHAGVARLAANMRHIAPTTSVERLTYRLALAPVTFVITI